MELGSKLKKSRERKKYSQQFVAEKLHISRQAISKWENGHTYPDVSSLQVLSKLYDISLDELLKGTDEINTEEVNVIKEVSDPIIDKREIQTVKVKSEEERKFFYLITFSLLVLVSCIVPPIGIIISIVVMVFNKKRGLNSILLYILCIICLVHNIYDVIIILNNISTVWFWGSSTVERIS